MPLKHAIKESATPAPPVKGGRCGVSVYTDVELLAATLGSKNDPESQRAAAEILRRAGGLGGLEQAHREGLTLCAQFGELCNKRLCAVLELAQRFSRPRDRTRLRILRPEQAAEVLMPLMAHLRQEHIQVLLLDTQSRLIQETNLYQGALDRSVFRIAEIFRPAILVNAASVIIAHNHPSGDPAPTPEDVTLTERCVEAGRLLSIAVQDHLVIGAGDWVSMRAEGLGFAD